MRGTRIKSIIDELGGERIDIIRWSTEPDVLIANALKPAEVSHIELEDSTKKALVLVNEDQLSLAIGRKGQNVRLASKLSGWDIDIMTRAELEQSMKSGDEEGGDTDASEASEETSEGTSGEASDGRSDGPADGNATQDTGPDDTQVELPTEPLAAAQAAESSVQGEETPAGAESSTSETDPEKSTQS